MSYQVLRDRAQKRETSWSTDTAEERVTKSERLRFQKRQCGMPRSLVKEGAGPSQAAVLRGMGNVCSPEGAR